MIMKKKKNTKKSILSAAVCFSVAAPIVCLPLGVRQDENSALVVRKAYAATFPEEEVTSEGEGEAVEEAAETAVINDEYSDIVMNGGVIQSTYYDGYEQPDTADTAYSDVNTLTVYQEYDDAGLPIELLDPVYFQADDTQYYIAAADSILKETPDMSSNTLRTLNYGMAVQRIGIGDTWSKIRVGNNEDGYEEGYVLTNTLSYEMVWTAVDRIVWVDTSSLTLRAEPSVEAEVLDTLYDEDQLRVTAVADSWFKVTTTDGITGYVYSSYTTTQAPPTPTPTTPPRTSSSSRSGSGGSSSSGGSTSYGSTAVITGVNRESVVSAAYSMLGKPYVWGASSSSAVDCSGLVAYCYGLVGVSLPHYSVSLCSCGRGVSRSEALPGDVVCWDTGGGYCGHVGIYVGNGTCIDARGAAWGVCYDSLDMHSVLTIRRIIE